MHAVNTLIFVEHLVVLAKRDQEDEGSDVFETVNPLRRRVRGAIAVSQM